jgi:DNA-binding transcriptional regulator YhcF (GntR family)
MEPFVQSGAIVRVRGSGCWIQQLPPGKPAAAARAVDHVAHYYRRQIAAGHLKTGTVLPLVKEMAYQNRCAARTVIGALRQLIAEGLICKTGRSYRVMFEHGTTVQQRSAEIIVYNCNGTFTQMTTASELKTPAYRAMELELNRMGCTVCYRSAAHLQRDLQARAQRPPRGIMVGWFLQSEYKNYCALLQRLHRSAGRGVQMLVVTASHSRPPRHISQLCTGNVTTVRARRLAEFIRDNPARSVCYFQRYASPDLSEYAYAIKILRDISHFCSGIALHSRVQFTTRYSNALARFRAHSAQVQKQYVQGFLSKYPAFCFERFYPTIDVGCGAQIDFSRYLNWKVWVFDRDEDAVAGLRWLERRGRAVPAEYQLITLEGSDEHFGEGLTICNSDWQTTGYLMAHALLGDMPIARTGHGFLRTEARVFPRRTTRSG